MRLSKRGEYGLRAMIALAAPSPDGNPRSVQIHEIAEREQMAYEPCGCPDEETCGLRLVMGDVRNAISSLLDGTSLADVTQRVSKVQSERLRK
jgi:DNA-binding IscR family transcriptional regulator